MFTNTRADVESKLAQFLSGPILMVSREFMVVRPVDFSGWVKLI